MKNKKREHNKFVDETILRELYLTLSISKICEIQFQDQELTMNMRIPFILTLKF